MAIAGPLSAARGWALGCEEALDRARALLSRIGEVPERTRVLAGLATTYYFKGEVATSSELASQALEAAERAGGTFERLLAHSVVGVALYLQGQFPRSIHHLEQAIRLYDFEEHAPLAHTMGGRLPIGRPLPTPTRSLLVAAADRGVLSRTWASWCLVQLGHPDRGLAMSREAVALARRVKHPVSLAQALAYAGWTHFLRREPGLARERADEAFALAEELGFPLYLGTARAFRGWARAVAQGDSEGVAEAQQGIAELVRIRSLAAAAGNNVALAEAFWKLGRHQEALGALDLGVAQAQETGVDYLDGDLRRLRAEILLDQGGGMRKEAEDLLRRALEIAREQEAKSPSCGPRRAWRACSATKDGAPRPARSSSPSTPGSPKASTPPR
jgi:tetratricopeptide (TPR) repeat protein